MCIRVCVCVCVHFCVCSHLSTVVCEQCFALHCGGEVLPSMMGGKVWVQGWTGSSPSHIHLRLAQLKSSRGSYAKSTCPTVRVKIFFIPYPGMYCGPHLRWQPLLHKLVGSTNLVGRACASQDQRGCKKSTPKGSNKADQPFTGLPLLVPQPPNPLEKYSKNNSNYTKY